MTEDEIDRRAREYVYNALSDLVHDMSHVHRSARYHTESLTVAERAIDLTKRIMEELDPNTGSNLVQHAKRELEIIGEDPTFSQYYIDMLKVFSAQGHSGGSASIFIPTLMKLLKFEELSEITDDPIEWTEVGDGMWQSTRNPAYFSENGGHTYYDVDMKFDTHGEIIFHDTKRVIGK